MFFSEILLLFLWFNGCWQFISGSSAFSKSSLNIWKFSVHVLLKPSLENFERYFGSVWYECNCVVVWAFFGIAFLWDWNENFLISTYSSMQLREPTKLLSREGLCSSIWGLEFQEQTWEWGDLMRSTEVWSRLWRWDWLQGSQSQLKLSGWNIKTVWCDVIVTKKDQTLYLYKYKFFYPLYCPSRKN